jgi:hypothetical protein
MFFTDKQERLYGRKRIVRENMRTENRAKCGTKDVATNVADNLLFSRCSAAVIYRSPSPKK